MKREDLKEYFRRIYTNPYLMVEQDEEDPFADEGGEEGGDEEGGEVEEDTADDEAADAEGDTETEAEEEEVIIEPGDEVRLGKQFDAELDTMLLDFEADALKTAAIQTDTMTAQEEEIDPHIAVEWWNQPLANVLFEQDETEEPPADSGTPEAELDLERFASDVSRLIQNYTALLDMEGIIFNKSVSFLEQKYGPDVADAFEEILRDRHGLDFSPESIEMSQDIAAPLAIGTGGGGGMGGGE